MSERLEARAELLKLARLLAVDTDDLAFLDGMTSGELRTFRESATDRLFNEGAKMLGRVGAASRLVPAGVSATIAQRAFGPLLCARAVGTVDPASAVEVARRLPADFLADAVAYLDPRRVVDIIAAAPADVAEIVARELGQRGEHVTMGRFLAYVPDQLIVVGIGALDDEAMLRTAFVLEDKDRLDHAVGLLPPERIPGVMRTAADNGLWPEALDLLSHLSEERLGPIADLVADEPEDLVTDLVTTVSELHLWDSLLPVVRQMSDASRVKIAAFTVFHEPKTLAEIIEAAAAQGLWPDLVPLIEALPAGVHRTVAELAGDLSPELLDRILTDAVSAPHTFEALSSLLGDMPEPGLTKVATLIDQALRSVAEALLVSVQHAGNPAQTYAALPVVIRDAIQRAALRLGLEAELDRVLRTE
jgi:hypothetical protein